MYNKIYNSSINSEKGMEIINNYINYSNMVNKYTRIYNPFTNSWISIKSNNGKETIANYIKAYQHGGSAWR